MRELTVEIKDKEYVFALDREIIKRGEKIGLSVRKLMEDEPITQIDLFWYVGLIKKQPNISPKVAEDLFRNYKEEGGDERDVISFLVEEYNTFFPTTQSSTKAKPTIREV